jgi:hypothetical protein
MEYFTSTYRKLGRRRKRCRACSRLIQDGELATFRKIEGSRDTSNAIQGRGQIVPFTKWLPFHAPCFDESYPGELNR